MFVLTYIGRGLRRRARLTALVAIGLAVGIGLVVTVTAVSAGVEDAQGTVLASLYGVGTDITVTQPPEPGEADLDAFDQIAQSIQSGTFEPGEPLSADGLIGYGDESAMGGTGLGRLPQSSVDDIARVAGVADVAGALIATDVRLSMTLATRSCGDGSYDMGGVCSSPTVFQVGGVDLSAERRLGPLAAGTVSEGRDLAARDATADVAIVDVGYAAQQDLNVGSTVTVAGTPFEVVGLVTQPPGSTPAQVYIPLERAQELAGMPGELNTIYVAADRASDVAAVRDGIAGVLPSASVDTSESLAGQVSGSLVTTARLTDDIGRWLAGLVLVVVVALAGLVTSSAVAARSSELGLLRALGWQTRRVVGQVTGEAFVQGVCGAVLGLALGFGGAAVVTALSPSVSAVVGLPGGTADEVPGAAEGDPFQELLTSSRSVEDIELTAPVTSGVLMTAVVLALAGAMVAGAMGGWRAARLHPANALRRVE